MPRPKGEDEQAVTQLRTATTPEGRENQLIALAMNLAEKQLTAGTASAQVIAHYIKLGSSRERLEQERLIRENEFMQAKIDSMAQQGRMEELYAAAIDAMKTYSGQSRKNSETFDD